MGLFSLFAISDLARARDLGGRGRTPVRRAWCTPHSVQRISPVSGASSPDTARRLTGW